MRHRHTVVWLDHYEAIVVHVHPEDADSLKISSDREPEDRQLHRKSGVPGNGHRADDGAFYAAVADALHESEVILVTGPGLAKTSFVDFVHSRHADVARHIVSVQTLDHPTEGQLTNFARGYFKRLARLGSL